MKLMRTLISAFGVTLTLGIAAVSSAAGMARQDIGDTAVSAGPFKTLTSLSKQAGLIMAKDVKADIVATHGVIRVIDSVVLQKQQIVETGSPMRPSAADFSSQVHTRG